MPGTCQAPVDTDFVPSQYCHSRHCRDRKRSDRRSAVPTPAIARANRGADSASSSRPMATTTSATGEPRLLRSGWALGERHSNSAPGQRAKGQPPAAELQSIQPGAHETLAFTRLSPTPHGFHAVKTEQDAHSRRNDQSFLRTHRAPKQRDGEQPGRNAMSQKRGKSQSSLVS